MQKVETNVVDVLKLNLQPGDILLVKVNGPDFKDDDVCNALKEQFVKLFPNNKIGVLYMGDNTMEPMVISDRPIVSEQPAKDCSTSYCDDCSCGKKDLAESQETKQEKQ